MFNNIGNKIKTFAEVVSWIGIIASIIIGIISIISGIASETIGPIIVGILVALIGCLSCWISAFVLYGFGQLVENSDILVKTLAPNYKEDVIDNEKSSNMGNEEFEKNSKAYSNSSWSDSIKDLSNEELQERIGSEDWRYEYRALCKKELESRK